MELEDK